MNFIKTFFSREILVYSKKSSNIISPIVFFLICITFFPLAVSNDPIQLSRLAPGLIWICILLSGMLSIQTIFKEDFDDGSLDLFYAKDFSILQIILVKIIVNWLFSALPLIVLSSSMVFLLYFPLSNLLNLLSSLIIGTIIISFFGALAGALSLGKNSILASAFMLPLSLPVLILGSSASTYSSENISFFLLLLLSLLFLTIPVISLACMGAIRLHYE